MKNITQLISIILFFFCANLTLNAQQPFVLKVVGTEDEDDPGTYIVDIKTVTGYTYNYEVDWGDGNTSPNQTGSSRHIYNSSGTFIVGIYGKFPGIQLNKASFGKIISIEAWGDIEWETMKDAFKGAEDLVVNATDTPDLSKVKNTSGMFDGAAKADPNLSGWDVSKVTDMSRMFRGAEMLDGFLLDWDLDNVKNMESMFEGALLFNKNIYYWRVGNVTNMKNMFKNAESFNYDIKDWNVKNVRSMESMFEGAIAFNQNISLWNVKNVTNMKRMFYFAESFNKGLTNWNVAMVTNMSSMFYGATAFNQDISGWNVGNVERMDFMFRQANAFNQDLSVWNISKVSNMNGMFAYTKVFNQDISLWNVSKVTNMNSMFAYTKAFDQDLNNWNVSKVVDMGRMFEHAKAFNQNLNSWDLSNVETIEYIFANTLKFNGNISNWSFPKLTNMEAMFYGAKVFNQDLNTWDVSKVDTMSLLFGGAENFNGLISLWQLDNAVNMSSMFSGAIKFNKDIEGWKTPKAKNMSDMFYGASAFDKDLYSWKVATVENMSQMFYEASAFNSNLNSWQLDNVIDLDRMFYEATSFNGDVTDWKMPKAKSMIEMFSGAIDFNQDISDWDVANVADMRNMFEGANSFNQNLNSWDVSKVKMMDSMFDSASDFDQALDQWQLDSVSTMYDMLSNCGMSTDNYDKTLIAWASQNLKQDVTLGATNLEYCSAVAARNILINTFNWTIEGDKKCIAAFVTVWNTEEPGTSNDYSITIPTFLGETYDYTVDWGDGNVTSGITGDATHEYASVGVYTVKIKGIFPRIYFNFDGDRFKIMRIDSWGDIEWSNMEAAFFGCENMQSVAEDAPDLNNVDDMSFMFSGASNYNGDCTNWETSGVAEMDFMFADATSFNRDLYAWDVADVVTMYYMFDGASSFDQNLSDWDISAVAGMGNMFSNTAMSIDNYDNTIISWATLQVQQNVNLGADNLVYCSSENARTTLMYSGWNFIGDSKCALPFITTWDTEISGSSILTAIKIPTFPGETYNYTVDWGDGNITSGIKGDATHDYFEGGVYTVKITGIFPRIYFNNAADKDKIVRIDSWGNINWTSMESAFFGCSNLVSIASDMPDLSNVTDMSFMFCFATSYDGACSNWDVETVGTMDYMFADAQAFNGDISGWNVQNVTSMYYMFDRAFNFNQNLGNWNISNVSSMGNMLSNTALTTDNYDNTLDGWASRAVQEEVTLGADGLTYCMAGASRNDLVIGSAWVINGDVFSCSPLPVELTLFSGERLDNQQVELYWETASETNNEKFEVWRRFDTEEAFSFLGETAGAGTTTETQFYNFLDANDHTGNSYYQLKQVDFEGSFSWSNTIAVEAGLINSVVSVFPNPASEVLSVQTVGNKSLTYALYNPIGKVVRHNNLNTNVQINVSDLPAGIYWLQIRDVNNLLVETKKLLLIKE